MAAAAEVLARQRFVTPIDVCIGLRWLHARQVAEWRQGRGGVLEDSVQAGPAKLAAAFDCLAGWARGNGLDAGEAEYAAATPDGRRLRFTADGDPAAERAWRTRWARPAWPLRDRSNSRRARISPRTCW